jgi:hypothetical protein
MADEALRMQAEVVDKFTGPIKALRAMLLDAGREGAHHGETLAKGMGKAEAAIQSTAKSAKTILSPALAGLGVTGLGAGVAVAGIASALNSLTGNLTGLGQLSRETGMAADQLRIFQSVAGKFGISSDASASAAKTFADNMRDIRRGAGEISGFLQSQNPVIAQYYQKLRGTKNNDEANKIVEDMLEHVPNATDRGRLAAQVYGNADMGRLGDRHLGPISGLNAKAGEKLGPLPEGAVEQAERYERAIADLRSSMQRVGTTIATELLGPAERFTTWIDDIASGKRKDLIDGVRQSMHDIGAELAKIDWAAAGKSAEQMLLSTTALVKPIAESVREIAAAIRSFNEGKPLEALRHLDGGHGPLARKLAPLPGDEKFVNEEALGALRGKIGSAQEQGVLQEDLLKELQERGDKEGVRRLREAMDANSRHLKELEAALQKLIDQGATAQKSSLEGEGPFGGARVQTAAFLGGGGGFRRIPGPGDSASLPGGDGGSRDVMREQFREHLKRTVPGYDGGATVPLAPGASGPRMGSSGTRLPPLAGGGGRPARGALGANQQEAYRAARAEGLSDTAARALVANMSGESLVNPRDHHWDRSHMSQGIVQWDPPRAEAIRQKFGAYPKDLSVTDQTRAAIDEIRSNPRFRRTARALQGDDPNAMLGALVENFEAPQNTRRAIAERQRHYRGFSPNTSAVADAEPRPQGMERPQISSADGEGWAAREQARKAYEAQMRGDEARLDKSAGRAGLVGGQKLEANGSVSVLVQKPGPDTNVRTSTAGNLFKDVVTRRGRTMEVAEGT